MNEVCRLFGIEKLRTTQTQTQTVDESGGTFPQNYVDLLDHVTSYLSVVIMGDVSLHLDVQTDANTSSF